METLTQEKSNTSILSDLMNLAMNAYRGISFDPDKRGQSIINDYSSELLEDLKSIVDEEAKAKYIQSYKRYLSTWLAAKGRCLSPMITGPARFPVARNEKNNRSERNRYTEFREWRERAFKSIERQLEDSKPQAQKDNEEFELIKKGILSTCETIIGIDNGTERGYSRSLFVSNLANRLTTVAKNGKTELIIKCLDLIKEINKTAPKPVISDKHSIWKLAEQAEIKREAAFDRENTESKSLQFSDGEIVLNYAIDRLQIIYTQKPDYETISKLKKNAFKWAPSNKAWQRQLTRNAMYAASQVTGYTPNSL